MLMHDWSVFETPPAKRSMMFNLNLPGPFVIKNLEDNDYQWPLSSPGRDSMFLREACTRNEVWSMKDFPGACKDTNCIIMAMSNT